MLALLPFAHAQNATITITVTQIPAKGIEALGAWTLVRPDEKRTTVNDVTYTYTSAVPGSHFLSVMPPVGMSATLTQTVNGVTTELKDPQAILDLVAGDNVLFTIQYALVSSGKVSVTSEPAGLSFRMQGPNATRYFGTTPTFYDPMPVGQYSVEYDAIPGCPTPSPQSARLVKDQRIVLAVRLTCANLPTTPLAGKSLEFVEANIDGRTVTFSDVPLGQWFSESVHRSIESRVMSGYRDENGALTGSFGPTDLVTIAELAKIAHRIASIDESTVTDAPENRAAQGTWFAPFFASAEQRNWLVFLNRSVDPLRPATRAEVVATLLQALRIPRDWATGKMFTDVAATLPYADCIETAATKGLVQGHKNEQGSTFSPFDPINRAEMAKVAETAIDLFVLQNTSSSPDARQSIRTR